MREGLAELGTLFGRVTAQKRVRRPERGLRPSRRIRLRIRELPAEMGTLSYYESTRVYAESGGWLWLLRHVYVPGATDRLVEDGHAPAETGTLVRFPHAIDVAETGTGRPASAGQRHFRRIGYAAETGTPYRFRLPKGLWRRNRFASAEYLRRIRYAAAPDALPPESSAYLILRG